MFASRSNREAISLHLHCSPPIVPSIPYGTVNVAATVAPHFEKPDDWEMAATSTRTGSSTLVLSRGRELRLNTIPTACLHTSGGTKRFAANKPDIQLGGEVTVKRER
jgi:hypothetical protein